jgi:GT2 family glycosyltransferase
MLLRQALQSIAANTAAPEQVVVVDQSRNPIAKNELAGLLGDLTSLEVLHLSVPSLTRARNAGLLRCSREIILFLDDDVIIGPEALERILARFNDASVALVASPDSRLKGIRARKIWDAAGLIFARKKRREIEGYIMPAAMLGRYPRDPRGPVSTAWAQGFCFALRREVLETSGLRFDENLPAYGYGEDLDFTRSYIAFARSLGMCALLDPAVYVEHLTSLSGRQASRRATFMYVLHRYYLSQKHFPKEHLYRLGLAWSDVGELLRRLITRSGATDLIAAYAFLLAHYSKIAGGRLDG